MRLLLLGPPGSGKGTQAPLLAARFRIPAIVTGAILRAERDADSPLGRQARPYLDSGGLVPDALIVSIIGQRLADLGASSGWILDGFPRTMPQAEALDGQLRTIGHPLTGAVFIDTDFALIRRRTYGRRICSRCDATFHLEFSPPKRALQCDGCGGPLIQRGDDRPETVERRLATYLSATSCLVPYYQERSLLFRVDGNDRAEAVFARIVAALEKKEGAAP